MEQSNMRKVSATHNMGLFDYIRYDMMLKKADELALMVRPPNIDIGSVPNYYSILKQIYINFRPIISREWKKQIDGFFDTITTQMLDFSSGIKLRSKTIKIDTKLLTNLENIHILLLDLKQHIGLGIKTTKYESFKRKLERNLLGLG